MNGAPELVTAWPRHIEPNSRIPFRIEKHSTQASAIHNHPILLDLSRKAFEHSRAKVVPFSILVPDLNCCRESEAEHSLLRHELEILDRDLDDLLRLSEYGPSRLPPESARDGQHKNPSPPLSLPTFHAHLP